MADDIAVIAVVLMFGLGLALRFWVASDACPPITQRITRSFWCPLVGRKVTAEFQEEVWDPTTFGTAGAGGRRVAVESCTAFTPASAITCERTCLGEGTLLPAGAGSREA